MTIKIYGSIVSTSTQRLILTTLELGIQYDWQEVNLIKGEHKSPDFVQSNHPFGRIPALEDGPTRIFESRAICRYLSAKFAKGSQTLYYDSSEPASVALWEEVASVEYSYFDPSMAKMGYEKIFKKFMGKGEANPDEVEVASHNVTTAFDYFNKILSQQPYLSGQSFGLLDIYVAPWINFLPRLGLEQELSSRQALEGWWSRVTERPSWQEFLKLQVVH